MSLFIIFIVLIGLIVGSFINVVIYRLPRGLSLALPRSYCPKCKHKIAFYHNIPVVSYVLLRGKCPYCRGQISLRYPLVELLSAILAVVVVIRFGISWQTAAVLLLTWALIALTFIDFEHMILPDEITLPFLWLGLLLSLTRLFATPEDAIIGAITGYLFLWLVAFIFKKIRKIEGMGYGDFKLLALFGAWLGWQNLPFIVLVASILGVAVGLGLIISKRHTFKKPIPFGPYLVFAGWIAIIWGA